MPQSKNLPGWFHVKTDKGLNGRSAPKRNAHVKYLRPKNYNLYLRTSVTGDGLTWFVSRLKTYYCADYLTPGKAPKPPKPKKIASPAPGYRITTPWGKKPRNKTYWQTRGHHTGADYACRYGTPVVAVLKGTVYYAWDSYLGHVALLFADNGRTYWYCHLSHFSVKNGTKVKAGQVIARSGQSGKGAKFGPHLHFEMRMGHTRSWSGRDYNPKW